MTRLTETAPILAWTDNAHATLLAFLIQQPGWFQLADFQAWSCDVLGQPPTSDLWDQVLRRAQQVGLVVRGAGPRPQFWRGGSLAADLREASGLSARVKLQ